MENKSAFFVPDEEMIKIWLEDLLYECGKNSQEELTPKEIEEAIEETRGTISNEKLWSHADPIHFENIANLEAYISELEDLLEKAKQRSISADETTFVKSESPYAPQNYLSLVLGRFYLLKTNNPAKEVQDLLKANNKNLRDFPLNRIDLVVKNKVNVVLVDCSHYVGYAFVAEYRWFEVDCDVTDNE